MDSANNKKEILMSKQDLHTLIIHFNQLSEGDLEKDRLRVIIKKEMENVLKSNDLIYTFS